MRGSLTLEFILSLVLLIATAGSFIFLANTQLENTVAASTQLKAEAMAMEVGSAITHFVAAGPAEGSFMVIDPKGLPESAGQGSFGMPGLAAFATSRECNLSISPYENMVVVDVLVHRQDSEKATRVKAKYPIAGMTGYCGPVLDDGIVTVGCGSKGMNLTVEGGFLVIKPVEGGLSALNPGQLPFNPSAVPPVTGPTTGPGVLP